MAFSRADVLATAARSPAAASARDRDGWVGLFTPGARVEDPVGSRPHWGPVAIGHFYDTFIGPRDVEYLPDVDLVAGLTVIRDGVLRAGLGAVTLDVPIYIRYVLQESDGELKIAALSAFWELPAMVGQFLRGGVAGVPAGLQLSGLLLANQGVLGTWGFLGGFRGAGSAGKRQFGEFLADAQNGDEVAIRRRLAKGTQLTGGDGTPITSAELRSRLAGGVPRKVIAAGSALVAGIDHDGRRDILFADVSAKPFAIRKIRYFPGTPDDVV
ncbi:hypothetical protein [Mycolicibacterium sp. XJ1819]